MTDTAPQQQKWLLQLGNFGMPPVVFGLVGNQEDILAELRSGKDDLEFSGLDDVDQPTPIGIKSKTFAWWVVMPARTPSGLVKPGPDLKMKH